MEKQIETNNEKSVLSDVTCEDFKVLCEKFLPKKCIDFVKQQADLHNKTPHQRRYSEEFLNTCLKIYFMGPKAYRGMSKIFTLPTKRTLNRITESIDFKAGLNNFIFEALKEKILTFCDADRNCCLCLDEMSIKSNLFYCIGKDEVVGFEDLGEGKSFRPALNVLVFMLKGIYYNWHQPLAYFFVHNTCSASKLKDLLYTVISKVNAIGLKVRIVISDMGASNIKLANTLFKDEPVFLVQNEEIIYMFDTPHLMKATRNNLLTNTFHFRGETTSWQYIVEFFNKDQALPNRLAPKLTDSHMHPTNPEKMKVKLAVQVLSSTVVAAMSMKISLRGSVTEDYKYGDKKTNHSLSQNTLTGLASKAVL